MSRKRRFQNIDGKWVSYDDWLGRLQTAADAAGLSAAARDIANGALCRDAFEKGERPEFLVQKLQELAGEAKG